ncbi:MAG: hypothetical protein Q9180_003699 [Flavoplaca navasiana]
MVPPQSTGRPVLHLNTNVRQPRQAGVHFDAPLRPRASTRGSPTEPIDSPPFIAQPDSGSSDSEAECWMRGRSAGSHHGESYRPPARTDTNLFGILTSSATFNEMDLTGLGAHRGTLATLALRRIKDSTDLPIEVYARVLGYLDFQSYKAIRLTCRSWWAASTYVRPLRLPPIYALPAEIIKHVYSYLSPMALDSARHTCRKWMTASLEYRLLANVMRRAGYWNAVLADTTRNERLGHPVGGEWRLSKRLATECCLSSKLFLSSTIDFTMLQPSILRRQVEAPSLDFVVSVCGKFLLLLDASVIHVYRHGRCLEFVVSVVFPGLVLTVSMDASQDRYSIAALLYDRRGLIIDVPELSIGSLSPHSEHDTHDVTTAWDIKASPTATPTTSQRPRLPIYTDVYHTSPTPSPQSNQSSPIPVQFIPHTMYRNICSKTAPPLTVAIAPHRRCIAFGSSAGIELHWQDSATGQELSRWIELIGPAECLHFIPQPATSQNEKKDPSTTLRLIASRAVGIAHNDTTKLSQIRDNEHCRFLNGIPLSDGQHLLYTDPHTGDLCLGTGLHLHFGSPKPIRQFVFQRPESRSPRCYTAGRDLQWGLRVAVAFGDHIYLYCIPPDWLVSSPPLQTFMSLHGDVQYDQDGMIIIRGIDIDVLPGLTGLSMDTSRGVVVVWAFSNTESARVYRAYVGEEQEQGADEIEVFAQGVKEEDMLVAEDLVDEGYVSDGCEGDEGWDAEKGEEEVDRSLEDGWGDMQLVRLEVDVLCGG